MTGFEPATPSSRTTCATKLRHIPIAFSCKDNSTERRAKNENEVASRAGHAAARGRIERVTSLPALIAFDLDDTLAPSKSPLDPRMLGLLEGLLEVTKVAVISGGNFAQFEAQILDRLGEIPESRLERLHLMPTCGTRYVRREEGAWVTVYEENLTIDERTSALTALREEAERLGLWESRAWGEILEDRGSQVTFSALGQRAPVDEKVRWDPTGERKGALRQAVAIRLPSLEVRSGGSTSVDITRSGIDKAYGMRKLEAHTGVPLAEMLFVGDRLDPEGNDYPVLAMGVRCQAVDGWEQTAVFLEGLLAP